MGTKSNPNAPQIIRETSFDQQLNDIAGNYSRLDELDSAIDWALSHNPTAFYNLNDGFYLWKMERISNNFPQLRLLYHYDESKNIVYLIAVTEIKSK